jgi:hypothetical protein
MSSQHLEFIWLTWRCLKRNDIYLQFTQASCHLSWLKVSKAFCVILPDPRCHQTSNPHVNDQLPAANACDSVGPGNREKLEVGWQTLRILMSSVLWGDLFGESIFLVALETTPNHSNGLPSEKICWPRLFLSHNM